MTAPIVALPISAANGGIAKKKRVLLLDTSQTKRDLRADVMRKLGIEVDCAADVLEARCWWRADLYNLVLINATGESESRDKFCTDIRGASPAQQIAFFVGSPHYLAAAPHSDIAPSEVTADALHKELEACKKISSVRSVSEARSRAIRETPRPSRWAEAIERHSEPEDMHSQPTFSAAIAAETISAEIAEREEIL
jgi:DNA-binding NtrC family response regulator